MTVLFPLSLFGCLLFCFLVWVLWLGLPILCWIELVKVDNLVLFLILLGKIYFLPIEYDVGCRFLIYGLIMLRNAPSIPTLLSVFYQTWSRTLSNAFSCIYWYDHVIFVFAFVYVMYYIYWFANILPSLHPWDESHLIMVYDLFDVLLYVVCQYFVEDFRIYVHQCYWPEVFFLCYVFIWCLD